MKNKPLKKTNAIDKKKQTLKEGDLPGYPSYLSGDDIYNQYQEEKDSDPEDISKIKTPNEIYGANNEADFISDPSGNDLDVPGSELDDDMENMGHEDEENNYYSIGGDSHNGLEEDMGD